MQCATHVARIEPVAFTILSVSPVPEDHFTLGCIFHDCAPDTGTGSSWQLSRSTTMSSALGILRRVPCTVVICERDLPMGSWKDLLEHTQLLTNPPFLIVTSLHADDYLWAEALNLGAYDVLAKPFDRAEIIRIVSLACLQWRRDRTHTPGKISLRQEAEAV